MTTETPSTSPAPEAGSAPAVTGSAPAATFSTVIPEEYRDKPYLKDFLAKPVGPDTYKELFKKVDGLETLIGKKSGVPAADAKPEEWDAFHAKLRPESADAYELPLGKDADPEFAKTLKSAFFEAGATKGQAAKIVEKISSAIQAQSAAQMEAAKKQDEAFDALTKQTFGVDNERKLAQAKSMMAEFTPEPLKPFVASLPNESLVVMAGILNAVHAKYGVEDKISPDGKPAAVSDQSALQEEGRKLMSDPAYKDFTHAKHAETVARVDAIYKEIARKKA